MIHYMAYISMGFMVYQLVNVVLNFIFRQKIIRDKSSLNEAISVLIPARNEEKNIGHLLNDLQQITTDNLEVIVFDDQSTDNTASIIQKYAYADKRIKLIKSDGLPENWLGKNHACYQLARHAAGNYYLFADADIRLQGTVIQDSVTYIKKNNLGLLSVFPIQIQKTMGEKLTVPVMNYILLTLLPLIFVRFSPFTSHAAANGQFMLFSATTYKKIQPHKLFKSSLVEDITISRHLKKQNIKIACLTGEDRIKCRMYRSYNEAKMGFIKNVFMFFGNQPVLAFLFWIFTTLGFVPVLLAHSIYLPVYLATLLIIQVLYSLTGKQNILYIILFPAQMVFLFHVMIKSLFTKKKQLYTWKGRKILLKSVIN